MNALTLSLTFLSIIALTQGRLGRIYVGEFHLTWHLYIYIVPLFFQYRFWEILLKKLKMGSKLDYNRIQKLIGLWFSFLFCAIIALLWENGSKPLFLKLSNKYRSFISVQNTLYTKLKLENKNVILEV